MPNDKKYNNIKRLLFRHLKEAHAFWSYDPESITLAKMSDHLLIEKVLYHLDWEDIMRLFEIYPKNKIKEVWKKELCPAGSYLEGINRLFAYVLFDIKNPDKYLKNQQNNLLKYARTLQQDRNRSEKNIIA